MSASDPAPAPHDGGSFRDGRSASTPPKAATTVQTVRGFSSTWGAPVAELDAAEREGTLRSWRSNG